MSCVSQNVVRAFAPLLRLDSDEQHFPDEPDNFRAHSRFRQSNYSDRQDRGWNNQLQTWEDTNDEGAEYTGEQWGAILREALAATERRPEQIEPNGRVTRPRDSRNLWGSGSATGFFLELKQGYGHDRSGRPHADPARVFYDCHSFRDERNRSWKALAYWYFYTYNWNVVSQHEGDWEHVTLYFADGRFDLYPAVLFYAAHNEGYLISGRSRVWVPDDATVLTPATTPGLATHPIVFASRFGHPSYPIVHDPERYTWALRTWDRDIPSIETAPWRDYDGAWGEVGEIVHSTGPLGPWFKREADQVRLEDL